MALRIDKERSQFLMYAGCAAVLVSFVGLVLGVVLAIMGYSRGTDWLVHAGIAVLVLSFVVGVAGSAVNMTGFAHQIMERMDRYKSR